MPNRLKRNVRNSRRPRQTSRNSTSPSPLHTPDDARNRLKSFMLLWQKNTWLTAEEALAWGFIDEITDFDEDPEPVLDDVTALAFAQSGIPIPAALQRKQTESSFATRILSKFGTRSKTKISHKNVKPSNNSSVMNQKKKRRHRNRHRSACCRRHIQRCDRSKE